MKTIRFFGLRKPLAFLNKSILKKLLLALAEKHGYTLDSLSYVLVNEDTILHINRTHLQHDYYTDIITFDLSENPKQLQAEIYISPETVQTNAAKFQVPVEDEMLRVLFHGLLHLLGYGDKTTAQRKQMRAMEEHCLILYREKLKGKNP